jgi:hypothetical protein
MGTQVPFSIPPHGPSPLSLDSRSSAFDSDLRGKIKDVVDNVILVPIGANDEKAAE